MGRRIFSQICRRGFFLLIFVGNPNPRQSFKVHTAKFPDTFLQRGRAWKFATKFAIDCECDGLVHSGQPPFCICSVPFSLLSGRGGLRALWDVWPLTNLAIASDSVLVLSALKSHNSPTFVLLDFLAYSYRNDFFSFSRVFPKRARVGGYGLSTIAINGMSLEHPPCSKEDEFIGQKGYRTKSPGIFRAFAPSFAPTDFFQDFSCIASWETETTKELQKIPASFQCQIPRQSERIIHKSFLDSGQANEFHCLQGRSERLVRKRTLAWLWITL